MSKEQPIALHVLLSCLQLGFAPNEPFMPLKANQVIIESDIEKLVNKLSESVTVGDVEEKSYVINEFLKSFSKHATLKLMWTNSSSDWSDIVSLPVSFLAEELTRPQPIQKKVEILVSQVRLLNDLIADERITGKVRIAPYEENSKKEYASKKRRTVSSSQSSSSAKRGQSANSASSASSSQQQSINASQDGSHNQESQKKTPNNDQDMNMLYESEVASVMTFSQLSPFEPHIFASKIQTIQLLSNIYTICAPTHDVTGELVSAFADLQTDRDRIFFVNHFCPETSSKIHFLDYMIMQHFENSLGAVKMRKVDKSVVAPGIQKLMQIYWDRRPYNSQDKEAGTHPKSNYALLACLLLHMVEALGFPEQFSEAEIKSCKENASKLLNESISLRNKYNIWSAEDVQEAVAQSQALVDFIQLTS